MYLNKILCLHISNITHCGFAQILYIAPLLLANAFSTTSEMLSIHMGMGILLPCQTLNNGDYAGMSVVQTLWAEGIFSIVLVSLWLVC